MKTAIFIIGEYVSGKTSTIRALTGITGQNYRWEVRTLGGRKIWALVITSALQENPEIKTLAPTSPNFIIDLEKKFEELYDVKSTDYELLICPLEIRVSRRLYPFDDYLRTFASNGFDVRVACIENWWDYKNSQISSVNGTSGFSTFQNITTTVPQIKIPPIRLDIYNSDEHMEARKVRDNLYPQ